MKIAIVEDEAALANELKQQLQRLAEYEIIQYESGEQFLFDCAFSSFDLVFMDIQMKQMNGLETAKALRQSDPHVAIVFLTNDPGFVFEGYEVDAIRYWLKPIDPRKLQQLLTTLTIDQPYLLWNQNGELLKLYEADIYYLESDGHYVLCHHKQGVYRRKSSFKEECERLSAAFLFCHRSYFVNLDHLYALRKDGLELDTHILLPVSRSCRGQLQEEIMRRCQEDLLCSW